MKKNSANSYSSLLLLILLPIVISIFFKLVLHFSFLTSLTIAYGAFLFFLIPADVFSRSSLDYSIKSVNPTYKQEQPNFNHSNNTELRNFFVIALIFAGCLITLLVSD